MTLKIGILGGTGDLGKGLALRWSKNHHILIGSRDLAKALRVSSTYLSTVKSHYGVEFKGEIVGVSNADAASNSEIIVLATPYSQVFQLAQSLKPHVKKGAIIISPAALTDSPIPPELSNHSRSLAEAVAKLLPDNPVVSAFQTIPAHILAKLNVKMDYDVLVACDGEEDYVKVSKLIGEIRNLRPLYVGPLAYSSILESLTSLLLNIAKLNRIKSPSLKIL